ncbi:hypothetical protein TNCV_1890101 [Trichonephila clavipes]|nr:hypothetical protein TNCV_1890101 [Trichonephila clavipes]
MLQPRNAAVVTPLDLKTRKLFCSTGECNTNSSTTDDQYVAKDFFSSSPQGHLKHLLGDSFRFLLLFNNMTSETVEVARIALRLPPFWKSNVRLWIAQCDHAFTFSGISSDDTKYSALVANLDADTLSTCRTLC